MAVRITDDTIVTTCPARLFDGGQAITALAVAELLAVGHADDDALVIALRVELR